MRILFQLKFISLHIVLLADIFMSLFQVNYLNRQQVFSPTHLTAMMLTKLKETAEIALKTKVVDCVISVTLSFRTSVCLSAVFCFILLRSIYSVSLKPEITSEI